MEALRTGKRSGGRGPRPPGAPVAGGPFTRSTRGQVLRSKLDTRLSPYLFVSPYFILFSIFGLFPVLFTFWVSLHEWGLLSGREAFIGLDNYRTLLGDDNFYHALVNTLAIFAIAVIPQLIIALLLADALNRQIKFRSFFRVGVIIPYVTSIAAMAIIFGQLFGREFGLINYGLEFLGLEIVDWRNERFASWIAIATMIDWRWLGFNTLIYLAAMQSIPKDLYESAAIDGASRARQFWQITVPLVRPTIMFTVIISTIGQMQLFTEPVIFAGGHYDGGNQNQFQTVAMLMFEEAMSLQNFGYGAAIAWVIFVLIVLFAVINVLFVSRIRSA